MENKLTGVTADLFIHHIQRVLETGEKWEDGDLHYPVEKIVNTMLSIPGMKRSEEEGDYAIEGFSTNGWQWDWWQYFKYNGKKYILSGGGYFGGHAFELESE